MIQNDELILKPAATFAFLKSFPLLLAGTVFLYLAWHLSPYFLFFSLTLTGMAWYRFLYIRTITYLISPEVIRISLGIFFKRSDMVEMYRVKDYVVTKPLLLQMMGLMDITLKGTDIETPVLMLRGIPDSDLIDTIRNYVQQARERNRIFEIN
jgi:uncharacterized membrane protein YdbT with pleckstrin-like domain